MIDRESPLDPTSDKGEKIEDLKGDIEFKNVSHIYPSRPEVQVLTDFNLVIPAGKITALVGASGSGKSTIVGLIERYTAPYVKLKSGLMQCQVLRASCRRDLPRRYQY